MTVSGHIGVKAEFIVSLTIQQEFGIEIDFNDPRCQEMDRVDLLHALCTSAVEQLVDYIEMADSQSDEPLTVDILLSPAFEGGFTREQMDHVEANWDGEYNTTLSIRFDGTVDEVAREPAEVEDLHALDEWRDEWR